jgi:HD-like signal output (HDOD) protein
MTMDTLAHYMPNDNRPSDNEIYLVGLIHDIGYLVLKYLDVKLSDKLHECIAENPGSSLREIELEILGGVDHGELGAMLAQHWKLPESIITALRCHNQAEPPLDLEVRQLIALIIISEKLLPLFAVAEHVKRAITEEEWGFLGISPMRANEINTKVQNLTEKLFEH